MRRAIVPSTQSVATTAPNSRMPAIVVPSSTISQQKTGINPMRMNERTFGTVEIADGPGVGPSVLLIGRAGGIRTRDLLTPSQTR